MFFTSGLENCGGYAPRTKVRGDMGEKSPRIDHIPPQFSQPTPIYPRSFPACGHEHRKARTQVTHEDQKRPSMDHTGATRDPNVHHNQHKTGTSSKEAVRTLFASYPGNVPYHTQIGRSTECESAYFLANPTGLAELTAVMQLQKTTQPRRCSSSPQCCRRAQPDR